MASLNDRFDKEPVIMYLDATSKDLIRLLKGSGATHLGLAKLVVFTDADADSPAALAAVSNVFARLYAIYSRLNELRET